MSRDLDSPLTTRERSAVDAWLSSNKSFHSMRDHPEHDVPMLGGLWGFRPSLNRNLSQYINEKLHDHKTITQYGNSRDQDFLGQIIWPLANSSILAHDSFLCMRPYSQNSVPFPTKRQPANETACFVGCGKPCCGNGMYPFKECPKQCRPVDHPDWNYC
jgi:hypothetical protein